MAKDDSERAARLAEALRVNLRRRKDRAREAVSPPDRADDALPHFGSKGHQQ